MQSFRKISILFRNSLQISKDIILFLLRNVKDRTLFGELHQLQKSGLVRGDIPQKITDSAELKLLSDAHIVAGG